jgi:hypothetical protein
VVETSIDTEHLGEVLQKGAVEFLLVRSAEVGDVMGYFNVAHGGERGQQVEALEDEADLGAAGLGAFCVGEGGEVDAVDQHRAAGGAGETAKDVEEGGFAGAGGTDDGDELAWCDGEVDLAEGGNFQLAGAVGLAQIAGEDDGLRRREVALRRRVKRRCSGGRVGLGVQRGRMRHVLVFKSIVNGAE